MAIGRAIKHGLLRGVAGVERSLEGGRARVPLGEMRTFVLLQHASALGSVLHGTPVVRALREALPACRIVVVASGMSVAVYRHNPWVDALIETASPLTDLRSAVRGLRGSGALRGGAPATATATITTTGNERTKVAAQALLSGAGNRVGFTVVPELYRAALEFDPARSQIANNLRVVERFGYGVKDGEPELFFDEADALFGRRTVVRSGDRYGAPVVAFVTQTSVTQRKSWRAERFRAAAEFLRERYGAEIVFVGTGAEAKAIDELRAGLSFETTSVAGQTSLTELAAVLSLCDVGLTLDTGTMHVGRAVGLPMVIVAPAWSPPVEWLPVGDARFRILKNLDLPAATAGYVIDEVSVDEVTEALADLLERYPPGQRRG